MKFYLFNSLLFILKFRFLYQTVKTTFLEWIWKIKSYTHCFDDVITICWWIWFNKRSIVSKIDRKITNKKHKETGDLIWLNELRWKKYHLFGSIAVYLFLISKRCKNSIFAQHLKWTEWIWLKTFTYRYFGWNCLVSRLQNFIHTFWFNSFQNMHFLWFKMNKTKTNKQ